MKRISCCRGFSSFLSKLVCCSLDHAIRRHWLVVLAGFDFDRPQHLGSYWVIRTYEVDGPRKFVKPPRWGHRTWPRPIKWLFSSSWFSRRLRRSIPANGERSSSSSSPSSLWKVRVAIDFHPPSFYQVEYVGETFPWSSFFLKKCVRAEV